MASKFSEALSRYREAQARAAASAVDGLTLGEIEPAVWATLETVAAAHRAAVGSAVASVARQAGVEVDAFDVRTGKFTIKGKAVTDSMFRDNVQDSLLSITDVLTERLRQVDDLNVVASEFRELFERLAATQNEEMVAQLYGPDGETAYRAMVNFQLGQYANPLYSLANLQAWSEQGATLELFRSVANLGALDAYVNFVVDSDYAPRVALDYSERIYPAEQFTSGPDDGLIRFVTGLGDVGVGDYWTTRAAYVAAAGLYLNQTVSVSQLDLPGVGTVFTESLTESVEELPANIATAATKAVLSSVDAATMALLDQLRRAPGRTLGALAVIAAGALGLFMMRRR